MIEFLDTAANAGGVLTTIVAVVLAMVQPGRRKRRHRARVRAHVVRVSRYRSVDREVASWRVKAEIEAALAAEEARVKAERRVALALVFVPPGQRERYRQEWVNEMAQLSPQEAGVFALHLLLLAPQMGIMLALKRIFGRA
ncbi:hypothetical protein AB0940_33530 [Streptomyces sp. NPDC006656]|uniref:hypothetical protein n=1 Tax=Streptomyces sp. NPDC006656 TaxID=3156899 RepID=UPI003454A628